jgi:PAS domain S-box-containing protein
VTLRSIGDGVVTADVEGRVLMLSRMAEQLTGWREEEARGRLIDEVLRLLDQKTRRPRESPVARVLATGQIVMLAEDTLLVAKDGSERLVADSGAPIFDRDSRVIGVVVVFRDITEQHRLEQELYKAHKLESLGVLAGGIAHDFNNLLTAIIGNLSMARLDAAGSAIGRQIEAAEKAALRAQGLTQQLLTFAKGGAPIKAVASIADLVREAAEFSLHGAKTRYAMTAPPDLWAVEVDAAQMSQVINNLIINADQAMPGGGTITIELANRHLDPSQGVPLPAGPYVEIRVADQGHGIAPDHLERIFDPYFSTKQTGSGLGLASCYSIIKRHGGHIAVSSWPGEGAVFTMYLPARPDQAMAEPVVGASDQPLPGKGRVLVMDDEEMVGELAQAVLERLGYEADYAGEGGQALVMYRKAREAGRPYDVVIMDLTIPGGMGGQEAIRELLRLDPAARAIVSSGYAQDPVMANYREYGFAAVLAKPYSLEALSRVLHELFQRGATA